MSLKPSFIPSSLDVERYQRLRRLGQDLNHRILQTIPRKAMHEVGEAIGILHRGVLVFSSEDETSILMDCCLYDWLQNGKNPRFMTWFIVTQQPVKRPSTASLICWTAN